MTIDADLLVVLKAVTPRVSCDFAPVGTQRPYVTYQLIGGEVINPLNNAAPGKRNADVQINVWANGRPEARALMGSIEDAMRAASAFSGRPQSAAVDDFDADVPVFGCRQDFSIWFNA